MKKVEHLIKEVYPGSIAEELEIEPGDVLLSINDQSIEDVFDYRYMIKDEYIEVLIRKPDGEEWVLEIDKDYDDDLGIEFENQLMSDYKSCMHALLRKATIQHAHTWWAMMKLHVWARPSIRWPIRLRRTATWSVVWSLMSRMNFAHRSWLSNPRLKL